MKRAKIKNLLNIYPMAWKQTGFNFIWGTIW